MANPDFTTAEAKAWVASIARSLLAASRETVAARLKQATAEHQRLTMRDQDNAEPNRAAAHLELAAELRTLIADRWPGARAAQPPVSAPQAAVAAIAAAMPAPRPQSPPAAVPASLGAAPAPLPIRAAARPSLASLGKLPSDSGMNMRDVLGNRKMVILLRERGNQGATLEEMRVVSGFSSALPKTWPDTLARRNGFTLDAGFGDRGMVYVIVEPEQHLKAA